jgi:hypothetical protein
MIFVGSLPELITELEQLCKTRHLAAGLEFVSFAWIHSDFFGEGANGLLTSDLAEVGGKVLGETAIFLRRDNTLIGEVLNRRSTGFCENSLSKGRLRGCRISSFIAILALNS